MCCSDGQVGGRPHETPEELWLQVKGQLKFSLQVNWQKEPKNCPFIKHAAGVVASVMHNNKKQHHPYDSKGASYVCARGRGRRAQV